MTTVINRIEKIAGQDIPFTEVEKHLAEEYLILAERVRKIAGVAREALLDHREIGDKRHSRLAHRLQAIEYLANSAFYRDWDR
jgi:hypothetical protein